MVSLVCPANAKIIIRARCATPCGPVLEPAMVLSAANCRSVTITFAAFPGMVGSPSACKIDTLGDCHNFPGFMEYQFCRGVLVGHPSSIDGLGRTDWQSVLRVTT